MQDLVVISLRWWSLIAIIVLTGLFVWQLPKMKFLSTHVELVETIFGNINEMYIQICRYCGKVKLRKYRNDPVPPKFFDFNHCCNKPVRNCWISSDIEEKMLGFMDRCCACEAKWVCASSRPEIIYVDDKLIKQ